jgi:hypothetical protein
MTIRGNAWRAVAVVTGALIVGWTIYLFFDQLLSLPFRDTNDLLHRQESPVTLDILIPAGTYIDPKMSISEVIRLRFGNSGNRVATVLEKLSATIPARYRIIGTGILYLFWTTVSLVFFRIVTWMRYATALAAAFLSGAFLYYFMPDLVTGRIDDFSFTGWSILFALALRWIRKKHKRP